MGSCSAIRVSGVETPPHKRSERSLNFVKLLSLCPIIWHELRELRELPFKIKDLQRERRKTKHELHELPFKIKHLRANRAFMNQVNEVGAVERGYNEADKVDAVNFVDWGFN
jgi:hypothetical protein